MRLRSPLRRAHARVEIIPLIDVMFFLLASFMMVSLNRTRVENIPIRAPSATQAQTDFPTDLIQIAVDREGQIWMEKQKLPSAEMFTVLTNRFHAYRPLPVYIAGDAEARYGDMAQVLKLVRKAGIQKVSFTARATP